MGNGFGMGFGGGFMWLIWLLFVVVLIWLLKDVFSRQDRPGKKDKSALEILQERYARGEIDHDEFEQKRKDLTRWTVSDEAKKTTDPLNKELRIRHRKSVFLLRLILTVLVLIAWAALYRGLVEYGVISIILDGRTLRQKMLALGFWGPLSIIGLMALAIELNPILSAPIALASGAVFGHTWGTLYIIVGAEIGALIAFVIARLFCRSLLPRLFGNRISLGWLGSQNALTWMVFVSRLVPFISFDLVSYGARLTPLKVWRFALAALAGLIPASFLLAHFGDKFSSSNSEEAMYVLLVLGVIFLIPIALKGFSE